MNPVLTIGMILLTLGIIGTIYGIMMKLRAGRVTSAPFVKTGEAAQKGATLANNKGQISVEGNVQCAQPLEAPVSGGQCLFYELKVTASWKDGDRQKSKEITHEKRAAQFGVDDGSGPVWVDAREGGDFEPEQKKSITKSTGLIGGITGKDLEFGNYRIGTGVLSIGTSYQVEETVMPLVPKMYVCGKVGSSNEILKPSWRNLLLSNKSRDQYLADASKTAKLALIGGSSALAVGIILGIVSNYVGGSDEKTAKASDTATSAVTAAAAPTPSAPAADSAAAATPSAAAVPAAARPATVPASLPGKPGAKTPAAKPAAPVTKKK